MIQEDKPGVPPSPAAIYERYMVPAIFTPWAEALLDLVELQPGHRMLDVACGTGAVARKAIQRVGKGGRVVGLDFNPAMLEIARRIEPSLEWHEGNAVALPFPDQEFDVVTCHQGLQFFPDRLQAVKEMHRVLAHGGTLVVAVWCSVEYCPGYAAFLQGLERHVDAPAVAPMKATFNFGNENELRRLLEDAQFNQVAISRTSKSVHFSSPETFISAIIGGSNLARSGVKIEGAVLTALTKDVSAMLQPYVDSAGLAFPMQAFLAVARK